DSNNCNRSGLSRNRFDRLVICFYYLPQTARKEFLETLPGGVAVESVSGIPRSHIVEGMRMYSVVLMAALTAGTSTPSWGWGCHGGGGGGCHGGWGGGGCHGLWSGVGCLAGGGGGGRRAAP